MAPKPARPHEDAAALRCRAEDQLRAEAPASPELDPRRILHELQVHQIQLEMQNEELRAARANLEALVEKYTDLYDFAPVGYFSLDEGGRILEVNLPGAAMLGVERSKLLRRRFSGFVAKGDREALEGFLRNVFGGLEKQVCELALDLEGKEPAWVDLQAALTVSPQDGRRLCRLAVSDITAQKHVEEARLRVEALEAMNTALESEISRRKAVEASLRESRRSQGRLLQQAKLMEEELRLLSHQVLHVQEEERKRISHDLHDEIAQTLVAINVHLADLARGAASDAMDISGKIIKTQKLVEQSVDSVHRFAMGLRPTQLDDLGLVQALRSYIKEFTKRTEIPVSLAAPREMYTLGDNRSVVLYRVAQAALTNVAQHAKATRVEVGLRQTQRRIHLEISDDGKSFDVKKTLHGKNVKRLGLIGMRERVEMVGGKFSITSSRSKGTTIRVTVPRFRTGPAATATATPDPTINS
ncbi:MAG: PAS domain S-box protein [Puniceicoccaceae bacterium]|nr:MAG: PAS domain S-box protein [Puniceicoccaceae bacterium]